MIELTTGLTEVIGDLGIDAEPDQRPIILELNQLWKTPSSRFDGAGRRVSAEATLSGQVQMDFSALDGVYQVR